MKNKSSDDNFEEISCLIQKEQEDALAFFRAGDFRQRIERRLGAAAGRKVRTSALRMRTIPVVAAALIAVLAGASFLLLRRPAAAPAPEFKTLESALAQLPGFSSPPLGKSADTTVRSGNFRLADLIGRALVRAEITKEEDEKRISVPAGTGKVPRLSPERRMEILFQEKTVERALQLIKDESKEV